MLPKLLQLHFLSFYFEEIRDHKQHAALCNCNFVELIKKWGAVNLRNSSAEAPTFRCPINPHKLTHRCRHKRRWMRCDCHLSFLDHRWHHRLTRHSFTPCLLCAHALHTQNVNVTTCIIDLRSQLQQTPAVIKKKLFCFIGPLRFSYQLICIINSVWCPHKQPPLWFLLLGILSYFLLSLTAAAGVPQVCCIPNCKSLIILDSVFTAD